MLPERLAVFREGVPDLLRDRDADVLLSDRRDPRPLPRVVDRFPRRDLDRDLERDFDRDLERDLDRDLDCDCRRRDPRPLPRPRPRPRPRPLPRAVDDFPLPDFRDPEADRDLDRDLERDLERGFDAPFCFGEAFLYCLVVVTSFRMTVSSSPDGCDFGFAGELSADDGRDVAPSSDLIG